MAKGKNLAYFSIRRSLFVEIFPVVLGDEIMKFVAPTEAAKRFKQGETGVCSGTLLHKIFIPFKYN
jgi:hypothetical protein